MTAADLIGIAGAVASLVGAGIALWQAKSAYGYKRGAEAAAKTIASHRDLVANSSIADKCDAAMALVSLFGPGHTAKDLERRDLDQIVQDFRSIYGQIDTLSRRYGVRNESTEKIFLAVEASLNGLASAKNSTKRATEGRTLYASIRDLSVVVRQALDAQSHLGATPSSAA